MDVGIPVGILGSYFVFRGINVIVLQKKKLVLKKAAQIGGLRGDDYSWRNLVYHSR